MVKLEVGLSMLYCLGSSFEAMIEEITRAETEYIEIVDDGLHVLDEQRVSALKNLGESYSLKYAVHAPFAGINIALSSKPLLDAILRRLKQSIVHTSELNAHYWVFHPGMKTGISMFYPGMDWTKNLENVNMLLRFAHDHNVEAVLENVIDPFLMKNVEEFKRFYSEFGEDIGMVLDTGHANINGGIENFFAELSDKIVHIHVHDNGGKKDQHLAIGCGTVKWDNFAALVKQIRHDCVVSVESVEYVRESVDRVRRMLG